ncbi:MAG: SLBB domain-containing protein [Oligoflexia bacterium]|nr:SLBB domain-containing protein [Oligoflexia bacterium]
MKEIICTILSFLIMNPAFARDSAAILKNEGAENLASEYVLRRFSGEKLMPIRIIGGVQKPGVYYLPQGTDLLTAISLSGGLSDTADPDEVVWNQISSKQVHQLEIADLMKDPMKNNPALGANDLLMIKEKQPVISNNTLLLITAISSIVGIAVGVAYLSRR